MPWGGNPPGVASSLRRSVAWGRLLPRTPARTRGLEMAPAASSAMLRPEHVLTALDRDEALPSALPILREPPGRCVPRHSTGSARQCCRRGKLYGCS